MTAREDLAAAWDDGFTYATRLAFGGPVRDGDPNPYRNTGCSDDTCTENHSN